MILDDDVAEDKLVEENESGVARIDGNMPSAARSFTHSSRVQTVSGDLERRVHYRTNLPYRRQGEKRRGFALGE